MAICFSFTNSTYPIVNVCGDSLIAGYYSSPLYLGWSFQLGNVRKCTPNVLGVSGQTISQGTDNPFNFNNLPSKVHNNDKLILAWGINDCWKSTFTKIDSAYNAIINKAINVNGFSASDIYVIAGYYVENTPPYFTKQHYDSTITYCIQPICYAKGVHVIDTRQNTANNGGASNLYDTVHPNNNGMTTDLVYINSQL